MTIDGRDPDDFLRRSRDRVRPDGEPAAGTRRRTAGLPREGGFTPPPGSDRADRIALLRLVGADRTHSEAGT
ncbi:hypothetical protein ACWGIU_08020 [Streptomyces sp. NPDC054840]